MEKNYCAKEKESYWYNQWLNHHIFKKTHERETSQAFCIMLPPPNVTGSLHMGHAFQDSIIDILIRHAAQQGKKTFWQVGTDHAGIATQMVVTRLLAQQGVETRSLSRQDFLSKIWQWKEESGGTILSQLKRLGVFIDWEKERFTLDNEYTQAVLHAFITLYRDGLIYKSQRLVNWDCALQSAVSDLEVESQLEDNPLYTIRYECPHLKTHLCVSTTRPETLFGDMALAVHPEDSRYHSLIGQHVQLPLTQRSIPIIADSRVDSHFGTGVVKITPAHDFFDFKVGQDHQLGFRNILEKDGRLNEEAGSFSGLDRLEARPLIVAALKEAGLLERVESHQSSIPRSSRTGAIIEPYMTKQWYVSMRSLADKALKAHHAGELRFTPEAWGKNYEQWLENIEDWCISRQLVWGHQIPAWYDDKGTIYVGHNEQEVRSFYGVDESVSLYQDPDVLDTWFSSALWPFATLGWPKKDWEATPYFPNNVLVTGFDIIFFWVARMVMFSLYFTGKVPFHTVYIHGLIQDAHGVKMSKSKGNVIDPIDIIDGIGLDDLIKKRTYGLMQPEKRDSIVEKTKKDYPQGFKAYGLDALRLSFGLQATPTRFIRFDLQRVEYAQNVCHKLWNLLRYSVPHMNHTHASQPPKHLFNRWILHTLHQINHQLIDCLEQQYRFDIYAQSLVDLMWGTICDHYIEYTKVLLKNEETALETRQTLTQVMTALLGLFHPVLPFITEELNSLVLDSLEKPHKFLVERAPLEGLISQEQIGFTASDEQMINRFFDILKEVRRVRASLDVPPREQCFMTVPSAQESGFARLIQLFKPFWEGLTHTSVGLAPDSLLYKTMTISIAEESVLIAVPQACLEKRLSRIKEDLQRCLTKINKSKERLSDPHFCSHAPETVRLKEEQRLAELLVEQQALQHSLSLLS